MSGRAASTPRFGAVVVRRGALGLVGAVFILALASVAGLRAARADIVSASGAAVVAEPPANIGVNAWTSSTQMRIWHERTRLLDASLALNHTASGPVDDGSDLVSGSVAAGVIVQSYMVRLDPPQNSGITLSGAIVFNSPILGVFINGSGLDNSDAVLGRPGLTPNLNGQRGLELNTDTADAFEIAADGLSIAFSMYVLNQGTDDIRIVTARSDAVSGACCTGQGASLVCTGIAEPACMTLAGSFQGIGVACGRADNPTTCCPANYNAVGGITVQDIFDFLAGWFAGDPAANINGAGGITVQDVFDFLAAWFAGCG